MTQRPENVYEGSLIPYKFIMKKKHFQWPIFWSVYVDLFSICVRYYLQNTLLALNENTNGPEILFKVRRMLDK